MKRIELHAKTKFSMDHESTIDIKRLIQKCAENGERGIAIIDNTIPISFLKAERILRELNLKNFKLIYGVEINIEYEKDIYEVVVLLKNKEGIEYLYKLLSKNMKVTLNELIKHKKYLVLGLPYKENKINNKMLPYFDYVEVDSKVSKQIIKKIKTKALVIYSNKINALSNEETLSKKVLYNELKIKKEIENRSYQTTEEILKEVNDKEIVIDNTNKIFNMIEKFELLEDIFMPVNNGFDTDLLVYIELNKKYKDNIPSKIRKRVEEELKLIHELNYEGFINIYKEIADKCKYLEEEYIINDYINYLYIAYLLGITHFDPIKLDLNYDIFFSHNPIISIQVSETAYEKIHSLIKDELSLNTIKCKSLMRLNGYMLSRTIDKYEEKNNIKLTIEEKNTISKYLDNYPIKNRFITQKEIIVSKEENKYKFTPLKEITNSENISEEYTNIDYKDIEDNLLILELQPNDYVTKLSQLKKLTNDKLEHSNYKDKTITKTKEYQDFIKEYEKYLILDDLYEDLINSNIELPEVYAIINEIRKNKIISKNTKEILSSNNIKLKRYHDINFITRGTLNEKARLIYELQYFKINYPLEYYYIMLKDCPFNDIIEIVSKRYEEVVKKINNYQPYRYEQKILQIVKELYQSNIHFIIEERPLTEDYTFELDKENNKLTLVIKKRSSLIKKYLSNNLSLIGTRPLNGKMSFMSKIIHDLLDDNYSITLLGLDGNTNYYLEYLLNNITHLDRRTLHQYLNPCSCYIDKPLSVDKEKYIDGIKYLLEHDLTIKDYHTISDSIIINKTALQDKINHIINTSDSQIIIIDNIEKISDNIEKTLQELTQISKKKKINFIIFTNLKREYEEHKKKDITSFPNHLILDKYIKFISILDKEEMIIIKEETWEN